MQIAMIGLGRMGGNLALRLMRGGHDVVVYDQDAAAATALARDGAVAARDRTQRLGVAADCFADRCRA